MRLVVSGLFDPFAIQIRYRPLGGDGEFACWIDLPPINGAIQLDRAREYAKLLKSQGGWEVILTVDGKRVQAD